MNPILGLVALAVVAAGIAAISAREPRFVVLALLALWIGNPLVADPLAQPIGLAARFLGALLAAYLLWMGLRDRTTSGRSAALTEGSRIGWPAEVLVAAAAAVVGFSTHGLGAPADGPALASAAGFALAALSVSAFLTGADVVRIGVGLLVVASGAMLVRTGLGGTPGPFEHLVASATLVVVSGCLAAMAAAAARDVGGGFGLADPGPPRRREPDAHPMDAHPMEP